MFEAAADGNNVLVIGAPRDRRLRRWMFGNTPDRVVARARAVNPPVLICATPDGISGRIEDYLFPIYRYLRAQLNRQQRGA